MEKSGHSSRQRLYPIAGGRARLVAATGGDSAGVSQTDHSPLHGRQPRPLGWSFMGWRQACIASQSQRRLWDVRYTGGGRLERRVERWAAQRRNVSRLVDKLFNASSPARLSLTCIVMECSVRRHRMYTWTKIHFISIFSALTSYYV